MELRDRIDSVQQALGRIEARQVAEVVPGDIVLAEFKVSSQWGEDGIIAHLLRHVSITSKVFVEFGVQDYKESNTRFLLRNSNWCGLVLDGSVENIAIVRKDPIYWRHNLKADAAFVTRENINELILRHGIDGDMGLLSIDIDGNDYWVWQAIFCISPRIVVAEYNALFGPSATVSVPYDPTFVRTRAHYSNLYWGCSLSALTHLAAEKGYGLVGCNTNGNNAFFVRRDVSGRLPLVSPTEAYRPAHFREARDLCGTLNYLTGADALSVIKDMPLIDVITGKHSLVGSLTGAF